MHDKLGNHAQQKKLDQTKGEPKAGPVVTVLHDFKAVAFEVDIAIKVHFVKRLHGDLVGSAILDTIGLFFEVEIELDGSTRKLRLLIASRAN